MSYDKEKLLAELAERRAHDKKLIIRILTITLFMAIIACTGFGVAVLAENGAFVTVTLPEKDALSFSAPPPADYDITADREYNALVESYGFISYCDSTWGRTVTLPESDYDRYGAATRLIIDLLIAARDGDSDAYNDCFSDRYIAAEGETGDFSKQQIYDALITYVSETEATANGRTYLSYVYRLSYKINENDGSLRNDFHGDSYREQTLTLTTNNDSAMPKIDSISVETFYVPTVKPNAAAIILTSIAGFVILFAAVFGTVVVFKKTKTEKPKN